MDGNRENPLPNPTPPTLSEAFMELYAENEELEVELEDECQFAINQNLLYMDALKKCDEAMNRVVHTRLHKEIKRAEGHAKLIEDYFQEKPYFNNKDFRRRNRMHKSLFLKILHDISTDNVYFQQRPDALGVLGLSGHKKIICAIRMLAYGVPADACDEYIRIGEKTASDTLKEFCKAIYKRYASEYLRRPTKDDVLKLLVESEKRGFPGMLGSVDCMHWEWRNCPHAWKGQYIGKNPKPTIVLEAEADMHGWFWHANFGMPGSLNDLNIFAGSDLLNDVLTGNAPPCDYVVNGREYDMGYYPGDGIYLNIATIVKSIKHALPGTPEAHFRKAQESVRKDIERSFVMLHARFECLKKPCKFMDPHVMGHIMRACIILNNMIVQDERGRPPELNNDGIPAEDPGMSRYPRMFHSEVNYSKVYNKVQHEQLTADLVAHMCSRPHRDD